VADQQNGVVEGDRTFRAREGEEMKGTPYYITTAIAYASAKPHIGNSYEIVLADSIARFKRSQGYDVFFQTGTDEHGQKIEQKADAAGMTPKEYVDKTAAVVKDVWDSLNTSYDKFIRTTDEDHERQVQKIFKRLYEQDDIYKGKYEGMYCTACESFFTPSQLTDGRCPDCGGPVTPTSEEAYFFRMSKYAQRLIDHINTHPEFIQPVSRKNEMMNNFLLPGLQDLCVSRSSFTWGIPVDFAPGHVVYVWLDALTNYITGIGYDAEGNSSDLYKKLWPADLHLIGKDIIRFHTIYWPIFLMALGEPLPKQVFGHPWLLQGKGKMSKSKGNVLYADELIRYFGVDGVRYFVLHEMPFENDGIISWELMVERTNSDLVNTLGNLVKRTISMTDKYFGGTVRRTGAAEEVDADLKSVCEETVKKVVADMDGLRVADALTDIFNMFKRCNKYIDETMPWALAKDEEKQDRLAEVLYNLTEGIYIGASLLEPFLPGTAEKIAAQLNVPLMKIADMGGFGAYPSGTKVCESPESLFERMDVKAVMAQVMAEHPEAFADAETEAQGGKASSETAAKKDGKGGSSGGKAPAKAGQETKTAQATKAGHDTKSAQDTKDGQEASGESVEYATIDDFCKLKFAVGEVVSCEAVPKSKKLLCLKVRLGDETRQILSGIHKWYEPDQLVGKKVMVVTNLKPVKLAGMLSEGMVLSAEDAEGNVCVMTPEKDMPSGSEIR
jgi:methionyl-tRNA synthetase